MLIEVDKALKRYVYCWRTRSSIRKTFSFCEEIMNVPRSTESTGFTMNVKFIIKKLKISCYQNIKKGKRRYNIKLWKTFTDCFNCLPVAAIVDDKIFCMHGGLSPELTNMEQIRRIIRPTDVPDTGKKING